MLITKFNIYHKHPKRFYVFSSNKIITYTFPSVILSITSTTWLLPFEKWYTFPHPTFVVIYCMGNEKQKYSQVRIQMLVIFPGWFYTILWWNPQQPLYLIVIVLRTSKFHETWIFTGAKVVVTLNIILSPKLKLLWIWRQMRNFQWWCDTILSRLPNHHCL